MENNPFVGNDGTQVSVRQDAQRRAMAMSTPCCSASDMGSSGAVSNSDQSAIPASPHPLSPDMALQARKEWRQHGEGLTQVLEDKRQHAGHQQNLMMTGGGGMLMRKRGALVVRVVSAEKRVDLSGAKYTAYVIRVQFDNPSSSDNDNNNNITSNMVEHRYSEFAKVNALFKKHEIVLDNKSAAFPSKHWAGRVGNWTPSLTWAPEKHDELINYRVIQLDCWLVHVVNMYNEECLPMEVAQALYDFLVAPSKPPCDDNNDMLEGWKWNNPISFTLGSGIRQATQTVQYMCQDPYKLNQSDHSIPLDLLHAAKGLCFMTVVKAGLVVSGRIGTGVLVARMDDPPATSSDNNMIVNQGPIRWSAPCAIGTVGMGWGALAGADVTHYLIILTSTKAVQDFCSATSVQLGAEMGVAVGPIGRGANSHLATGDWTLHPAYAYAHSQGLFVGMSLEGSVVSVRNDVNAKFYGRQISSKVLLRMPGPRAAQPLYRALNASMQEHIPDEGFRPSTLWSSQTDACYANHPNRPVYMNQPQSLKPPPIMPIQGSCFEDTTHADTPSPQHAGSGSMESYNQSFIIPGPGRQQQQNFQQPQQHFQQQPLEQYHHQNQHQQQYSQQSYASNRPQTIETMNPGPQPLFDPTSPSSTVGSNGHQW